MTRVQRYLAYGAALGLMTAVAALDAQQGGGAPAAAAPQGGGRGAPQGGPPPGFGRGALLPEPVPPPQNFATSTEHYEYLLRLHQGGTTHTHASVPKWEGLWAAAGNTSGTLFVQGGGGFGAGGAVIPGVLTPAYEA